ncbi:MAG: hypothetical protein ACTSRG_14030 [Candidatus Helarchaeota archaeon]
MYPKFQYRIFVLSILIVVLTGLIFPVLSYPLNYTLFLSVLLSIIQTIAFWGLILIFSNLVLHFDRKRREYKWREFGMTSGIAFIPILIYNIIIPIINSQKADNLAYAWDINLIRIATSSDSFQILFFLSKLTTVVCVVVFLILLSISIRDTFELEFIKAVYLCVFVVILAFLLSTWIFTGWEVFEL